MKYLFGGTAVCKIWTGLLLAGGAILSAQNFHPPSTLNGEWPTYGGDLASSKYSPLDQITKDNFAKLKIIWRAKTPDAWLTMTMPGGAEWTQRWGSLPAIVRFQRALAGAVSRPLHLS